MPAVELLLVAAVYGVAFEPRLSPRLGTKRCVLMPGCFNEHLRRTPPLLLLSHQWESVHGRFVRAGESRGWGGEATHLELVMSSRSPAVVDSLAAGAMTWCSPGWETFDDDVIEDGRGPLRRIFSAHLRELSLTQTPACRGHRAVAWRYAA